MATVACTVCEIHAESTFKIEGMDCREEVAMLERRFKSLSGLEGFHADLIGQRLHVKYDAAKLSASTIASAVADAGMRAWLEHEEPIARGDSAARTRMILLAGGAGFFACGLIAAWAGADALRVNALYAASIISAVPLTAGKAWVALKNRSLDINVLMLIAAGGAIVLGQWSEAIDQLGCEGVDGGAILEFAETAIQTHAQVEVRHIGFGDHDRRIDADLRRELFGPRCAASLEVDDRVLEHRLVKFEPDLLDVSRLLISEQVAGAADVEVVAGELESGAEAVEIGKHLKALVGTLGHRTARRDGQIGVGAGLRAADTAAQLV